MEEIFVFYIVALYNGIDILAPFQSIDTMVYALLGLLQGIVEWLPISSEGQTMLLAINAFNINPSLAFSLSIWAHLGTAGSVLIRFFRDWLDMFTGKTEESKILRKFVIIATLFTAVTAIPLYFLIGEFLENSIFGDIVSLIIGIFLVITGILLTIMMEKLQGSRTTTDITNKDSILAGLVQGVAILPGISRSGVTNSYLLSRDYKADTALYLSFLMSLPAIIAAAGFDFIQSDFQIPGDITGIIVMIGVAFIVGLVTMEILIRIAQKISFGYFCIAFGAVAIILVIIGLAII